MEDKYNIAVRQFKPTDTIIIHFKKYCDIDSARQIYENYQQAFPNNNIIWTHEDVFDIEVKEE